MDMRLQPDIIDEFQTLKFCTNTRPKNTDDDTKTCTHECIILCLFDVVVRCVVVVVVIVVVVIAIVHGQHLIIHSARTVLSIHLPYFSHPIPAMESIQTRVRHAARPPECSGMPRILPNKTHTHAHMEMLLPGPLLIGRAKRFWKNGQFLWMIFVGVHCERVRVNRLRFERVLHIPGAGDDTETR